MILPFLESKLKQGACPFFLFPDVLHTYYHFAMFCCSYSSVYIFTFLLWEWTSWYLMAFLLGIVIIMPHPNVLVLISSDLFVDHCIQRHARQNQLKMSLLACNSSDLIVKFDILSVSCRVGARYVKAPHRMCWSWTLFLIFILAN